jgi:RNA polymerase sigma-70 factor (ECF subfamily)
METSSSLLLCVRDRSDEKSWREFVQIYEPLVLAYARKQGLSESGARDVAQDVFIQLVNALPTFEFERGRGRFRTWLWTITRNATIERGRKEARRARAEVQWQERHADPDPGDGQAAFSRAIQQRVLEHAMQKLEPLENARTWACFREHAVSRRPAAVVANELGISVNSVYINASRVLEKIRKACHEAMGDLGDDPDGLPG